MRLEIRSNLIEETTREEEAFFESRFKLISLCGQNAFQLILETEN